jgi:hypothetical protein
MFRPIVGHIQIQNWSLKYTEEDIFSLILFKDQL